MRSVAMGIGESPCEGGDVRRAGQCAGRGGAAARHPAGPGDGGQEAPRVKVLRVVQDCGGAARFHDAPPVHDDAVVADLPYDAQVVGDEEVRHAGLGAQVGEQVEDLRLDADVEGGDRLVEDEQPWFECEGAGDGGTLALAAGQGAGPGTALALVQAHLVEELRHASASAVGVPGEVGAQEFLDGRLDRLLGVEGGVGVLEDHLHLACSGLAGSASGAGGLAGLAVQGDTARGRALQAGDHAGDRGLARPRLPHHGQRSSRRQGEADVVHGDELTGRLPGGGTDGEHLAETVQAQQLTHTGSVCSSCW